MSQITNSIVGWLAILNKLLICKEISDEKILRERLVNWHGPCVLSFANANALNLAWKNQAFLQLLIESDVILRDGVGIRLFMKLLNREPGLNLNGTDFIPRLLDSLPRSRHIAVYGTVEPYLEKVLCLLQSMGFETVHIENGFHEDEYYVAQYMHQLPSFVILAMGMPKQERVSALLRNAAAGQSVLLVNGGAIVDFMTNRYPRAPMFMRNAGIEWAFRLLKEPRRLWRRNIGSAIFIIRGVLVRAVQKCR